MGNLFFLYLQNYTMREVIQSTSVKPVSKLVTPAGNFSALSTESSQMVRCHPINLSEVLMMPSTPSSPRPVLESTSQELSSSISSQPLSMRSELEPTDNSPIQSNSSQEKKMLPTTSPEDITPLVRKSSISASTESESFPINAQVSKVSSSSTPSVEEPVPDLDLSSSRDFPLITVRNPSSVSPSTHPHRSPLPLLSHTTPCSPLTPFWSTLMLPLSLITRPSMISAEETSISRDQPTPT